MVGFLKQLFHLVADNRLHAAIVVVGTAVTMAFVMSVIMVYDFRTADLAPESDRSRTLYTAAGFISLKNGTNTGTGMGRVPFEALFTDCPGIEAATWSGYLSEEPCSRGAGHTLQRLYRRDVPAGWFGFYDYNFLAGRPLADTNYDGDSIREAVISRSAARQLSLGSPEEAVGAEIEVNFRLVRVVGVYEDVSPVFEKAYADIMLPFVTERGTREGLDGRRLGVLKLAPGADRSDVEAEIARREATLNGMLQDNNFHMQRLYDQVEYTFFRDEMINARLLYYILVAILLLVPAIGLAGLINAQMQSRLGEIAIRKAYGASDSEIMSRLFAENLVETLAGGILGYLLACVVIWSCREWLFGDIQGLVTLNFALLCRPVVALYILAACIVFTTVATLVPAWIATHRNIALTLKGND